MALLPGKSLNTVTQEEQTGPRHSLLCFKDFDSSFGNWKQFWKQVSRHVFVVMMKYKLKKQGGILSDPN